MNETTSIVAITVATRMLGEARTLEDVRFVRDRAEALRTYARAHDLGVEAMNYATESVAVYLGPDAESFARAFAPLGPIFRRVAG